MKKCLVAALIVASLAAHADTLEVKQPAKPAQTLQLSSPDIQDGATLTLAQVADSFGCSGKNLSPALQWTGVPKEAKSLVLTVYDPDAPTGSGFWHWAVYNLPASATGLPAGAGATDAKLPAPPSSKTTAASAASSVPARRPATRYTATSTLSTRWTAASTCPPTQRLPYSASA